MKTIYRIEIKFSAMFDNLIHSSLPFCSAHKDTIRPPFVIEATTKIKKNIKNNYAFEVSLSLVAGFSLSMMPESDCGGSRVYEIRAVKIR